MAATDPIGGYSIERELGRGGMGVVYAGTRDGRAAAVKVLLPECSRDADIVERFFTEARAASAIAHAGIVEVYDYGRADDGRAYIAMELLAGESLGTRLRRLRMLPPGKALALARHIAEVLAAAHAANIVHRDLKPDNVFLVDGDRVKLLDFGVAKLLGDDAPDLTKTGAILGTPFYMAPEQCRGAKDVDPRADLYSLGCMLFEMVCGRVPFTGEGAGDIIGAHLHVAPPSPRSLAPISEELDALVLALLAKDPAKRPASATDVIAAIDRIAASQSAATVPVATAPAIPRARWPWAIVAAGTVVASLGWLVPASSPEPPPPAIAPPPDVLSIALAPREPPLIEATIVGPPATSYILIDDSASAPSLAVRDDPGTLGAVVVIDVESPWLRSPGCYEAVGQALEHSGLTGIFGSRVVVITYDREARVAHPEQPVANLGDDALDDEETYLSRGRALAAAVLLAEQELDRLTTDRRLLILIGDGHDDDAAGAKTLLDAARARLRRLGIEVAAVTYTLPGVQNEAALPALVDARVAATPADIPTRMREVVEHLAHRTVVTFDARQLAWDGTAHHLNVRAGGGDADAGAIALPRWHETPVLRLAASIAGLALLAAGLTLRARAGRAR